jgi:hypothetical protein
MCTPCHGQPAQEARRRTCSTWRHGRGGMRSNIAAKRRVQGSGLQAGQPRQPLCPATLRSHAPVLVRGSHGIPDEVPHSVVTVFAHLLSGYARTLQRLMCATMSAHSAGKLKKR